MPTTMRPGKARQASRTSAGFFAAALPRITRRTPAASQASIAGHVADAAAELHRDGHRAEDGARPRRRSPAGRRRRRSGRPRAARRSRRPARRAPAPRGRRHRPSPASISPRRSRTHCAVLQVDRRDRASARIIRRLSPAVRARLRLQPLVVEEAAHRLAAHQRVVRMHAPADDSRATRTAGSPPSWVSRTSRFSTW